MKKYPAICIIEVSSIAVGFQCTDAMLKNSPVTVLKAGSVQPGKFLTLVGGSVASVEEAYQNGKLTARGDMIDHVFLPDVHAEVLEVLLGKKNSCSEEAIGIFETKTLCTTVHAADVAIKGTDIKLTELRFSHDLGGNAFVIYSGLIEEVQAALDLSVQSMDDAGHFLKNILIPRPDENLLAQIEQSSVFYDNKMLNLKDGEI